MANGPVAMVAGGTRGIGAAVAATLEAFGTLDHVVDCAAIARDAPVAELTDRDWEAVVATKSLGRISIGARRPRAGESESARSHRARVIDRGHDGQRHPSRLRGVEGWAGWTSQDNGT
jgi:NAD(P)-dependent dehydrogenase (short-subunit alcohol dehydrogenase family)